MRKDRWYHREHDPMLNSVLNGDWSNSAPGRQIPGGPSPGLEKVLISPWLVTLLHICGVIPTPRDRRRRRAERRHLRIQRRRPRIEWPPRDRRRRCPKRRRLHIERRRLRIERRYRRIEWRLFHDVLSVSWCFTSGSRCFTCVSWCFTCVSWCFTMFYNVLWCLASRATIGVAASVPARPSIASALRDRDNSEIGDNSAEIGDGAAGIVDIAANVIPC